MWGKNHCSTHRVFELNMNFQMLLFFVRPYDISRFLRFRTICVIFRQISFLHIFVHGVYMKLDNISFSSPKIICVSRDITCGCPYDIHGIALYILRKLPNMEKCQYILLIILLHSIIQYHQKVRIINKSLLIPTFPLISLYRMTTSTDV